MIIMINKQMMKLKMKIDQLDKLNKENNQQKNQVQHQKIYQLCKIFQVLIQEMLQKKVIYLLDVNFILLIQKKNILNNIQNLLLWHKVELVYKIIQQNRLHMLQLQLLIFVLILLLKNILQQLLNHNGLLNVLEDNNQLIQLLDLYFMHHQK